MRMALKPHLSKLSWEKAREIRRLRTSGLTLSQLQARFGVSRQWACMILKGGPWKEAERRAAEAKGLPSSGGRS